MQIILITIFAVAVAASPCSLSRKSTNKSTLILQCSSEVEFTSKNIEMLDHTGKAFPKGNSNCKKEDKYTCEVDYREVHMTTHQYIVIFNDTISGVEVPAEKGDEILVANSLFKKQIELEVNDSKRKVIWVNGNKEETSMELKTGPTGMFHRTENAIYHQGVLTTQGKRFNIKQGYAFSYKQSDITLGIGYLRLTANGILSYYEAGFAYSLEQANSSICVQNYDNSVKINGQFRWAYGICNTSSELHKGFSLVQATDKFDTKLADNFAFTANRANLQQIQNFKSPLFRMGTEVLYVYEERLLSYDWLIIISQYLHFLKDIRVIFTNANPVSSILFTDTDKCIQIFQDIYSGKVSVQYVNAALRCAQVDLKPLHFGFTLQKIAVLIDEPLQIQLQDSTNKFAVLSDNITEVIAQNKNTIARKNQLRLTVPISSGLTIFKGMQFQFYKCYYFNGSSLDQIQQLEIEREVLVLDILTKYLFHPTSFLEYILNIATLVEFSMIGYLIYLIYEKNKVRKMYERVRITQQTINRIQWLLP